MEISDDHLWDSEKKEPIQRVLYGFLIGAKPTRLVDIREFLEGTGVAVSEKALLASLGALKGHIERDTLSPVTLEEVQGYYYLRPKSLKLAVIMQIPYGWGVSEGEDISLASMFQENLSLKGLSPKDLEVLAVLIMRREKVDPPSAVGGTTVTRLQTILARDPRRSVVVLKKRGLIYGRKSGPGRVWRPTRRLLIAARVQSYEQIPMYKEISEYYRSWENTFDKKKEPSPEMVVQSHSLRQEGQKTMRRLNERDQKVEEMALVHHCEIIHKETREKSDGGYN